jgi:hypothetical protein
VDTDALSIVTRYVTLGLALGRHLDGLVDAYYGPPELQDESQRGEPRPLPALADDARHLIADLDGGVEPELSTRRRAWIRAQVVGLHVTARKLGGEAIPYEDEVEQCYGVRPREVPEEELAAAHRRLDEVLPGSGPLRERFIDWREAQTIPPDRLEEVIRSLAEDFRERTDRAFGLPDGESIEWLLETDKPWSGFNYYLGGLRSRVAINVDLPVLATVIGHLVAHEAYPGHHTEHSRKEVGLVRAHGHLEETIFLVGTPQCLLAEGLADLALEALLGERPEPLVAEHLRPLGVRYDADVAAACSTASEALSALRGNVALMLHRDGASVDEAVAAFERWGLLPKVRAEKSVRFLTDPTWSSYIHCYVEGLPLCRRYVAGDVARFEQLLTDPLTPQELAAVS